jgi:2-polyprenyl-6-methoxyphenol hydroxylase-like FAD-dependent oxidoreductase
LQELLTQATLERGIKIVYNAPVTSVDLESPKPSVTLQDARVVNADLIIGADGIFPPHPAPSY